MKINFEKKWRGSTSAHRGYACESFFQHIHSGARRINAGSVDFELNGELFDIKVWKNKPKLNSEHLKNNVFLLWFNIFNVDADGTFSIHRISEKETSLFQKVSFLEFSNFFLNWKETNTDKNGQRNNDYIKSVHRIIDSEFISKIKTKFVGKTRFLKLKFYPFLKSVPDSHGFVNTPALISKNTFNKFDRTVVLFYENIGNVKAPKIIINKWWVFEHDITSQDIKKYLQIHKIEEKYCATKLAISDGIIKEFDGKNIS
jgi:hypothetical protein